MTPMRLRTYNLFLTVESLEDDIYELIQSFEKEREKCRFGLIKPCFYKSFYDLVNSTEAVKQDLLETLSNKSIDQKIILELFHKVCVLESELYSLFYASPKTKSSEQLCTRDLNCKPYKVSRWQECGATCSPKTCSPQNNCLFRDTLSEPSSESTEEIVYVGYYLSSETSSSCCEYEPIDDRDYYTQSKTTCKRNPCMKARTSKTEDLYNKKKHKHYRYTSKPVKRKQSNISVHRKYKPKPKKQSKRRFDVEKSTSANLGAYSKKKPHQGMVIYYPPSETSNVSKYEPKLSSDDTQYSDSKSYIRKSSLDTKKSKPKDLHKKERQKPYKYAQKKEKTKQSNVSDQKKYKSKPKKHRKHGSKKKLNSLDVKKSSTSGIRVYSSRKKPQQESHIYFVRLTNENPKDIFGKEIKHPNTDKYYVSRMKRVDASSEEVYNNESYNLRNANHDMKLTHKKNMSRHLKDMENKPESSNSSDISNVPFAPSEYIIQYNNSHNSSEDNMYNHNSKHSSNRYKRGNTYNPGSNNEICVLRRNDKSPTYVNQYEVGGSHYEVKHYTHKKPRLQPNESSNISPKMYSIIHKPKSGDAKAKLPKNNTNGSQLMVLSGLIQKKNAPFHYPLEQNTDNNDQKVSKLKPTNNEVGKMLSTKNIKDNKLSSEVNNHREENSMKKRSAVSVKDSSFCDENNNQLLFTKNCIKLLSEDKSKPNLNQNDHKITELKLASSKITNNNNMPVCVEEKIVKDTSLSESPHKNVPSQKKTNNTLQPTMSKNKQNEEPLVYSFHFSKEKRRRADVSPMRSTLSLSDISTSICKPVTFIEELQLSEHKFNGKEKHKRIHKYLNHLKENKKNRMSAGCEKDVNLSSRSQKDMIIRSCDTLRDCKNIHLTKGGRTMSKCSASLDWKTIAQQMKDCYYKCN